MGLMDRCYDFTKRLKQSNNPLDEVYHFVLSERGRAVETPAGDHPLVLYFSSEKSRDDFAAAITKTIPEAIERIWP